MILIDAPLTEFDATLPVVSLRVERLTLAKRLWRGAADDGTEFGFQLARPLNPGAPFFQTAAARYVIEQRPEPVLVVDLDLPPSAAAGIGWAVGNLHLELQSEAHRLLAVDDPAVRQLFHRIQVSYTTDVAVFRPGRFVRGESQKPAHELGPSHRH